LIEADRTHDDGKQSHQRPRQRRATADRASGDPDAKGYNTYRDLEENAAFMLASIPKKIVQPKSRIASRKIEADGIVGARQILLSLSPSPLAHLQLF
jgi:hypothetical protein